MVEICLNIEESGLEYQPGDTIGVIPQNNDSEVEQILKHLKLQEVADDVVSVFVKPGTLKKKASVPPHIPTKTTLRHVLKTCLDIRAVPKKIFLRVLALYTKDPSEQKRLEKLCSKEGSDAYSQTIVETRTTLLDLLTTFPSCLPPVERLLEHLPRLQARPYSIASSPLKSNGELHIVYSLLELSPSRFGVCTGWLDSMTKPIQVVKCSDPLLAEMNKLNLQESQHVQIPVYLRKSTGFTLPKDPTIPLIFIGPGTGVAPFIGFLQHRSLEKQRSSGTRFGEVWLFYGCRYEDKDFLYRSEMEKFLEEGILTRLFVSFSRDKRKEQELRYVQDNIKLHGKEFVDQIYEENVVIYVCGDAKNMGQDVYETIASEIQKQKGIEGQEAKSLLKELQSQGRYLQDLWV